MKTLRPSKLHNGIQTKLRIVEYRVENTLQMERYILRLKIKYS